MPYDESLADQWEEDRALYEALAAEEESASADQFGYEGQGNFLLALITYADEVEKELIR